MYICLHIGVDDPYEEPLHPEINMKNYEMTVQQSVDVIMKKLREEGVYIWHSIFIHM